MLDRRLMLPLLFAASCAAAPKVQADPKTGDVPLRLTFNVTPDAQWKTGLPTLLYADARRNIALYREDVFNIKQFPGTYPRTAGQQLDYSLPNARVGEKIVVQGYMCAYTTTDCMPSDNQNPPICFVEVHVLGSLRPSCQPVFTWTGGKPGVPLQCRAECVKTKE